VLQGNEMVSRAEMQLLAANAAELERKLKLAEAKVRQCC
jgi:hypothetical protein